MAALDPLTVNNANSDSRFLPKHINATPPHPPLQLSNSSGDAVNPAESGRTPPRRAELGGGVGGGVRVDGGRSQSSSLYKSATKEC